MSKKNKNEGRTHLQIEENISTYDYYYKLNGCLNMSEAQIISLRSPSIFTTAI